MRPPAFVAGAATIAAAGLISLVLGTLVGLFSGFGVWTAYWLFISIGAVVVGILEAVAFVVVEKSNSRWAAASANTDKE